MGIEERKKKREYNRRKLFLPDLKNLHISEMVKSTWTWANCKVDNKKKLQPWINKWPLPVGTKSVQNVSTIDVLIPGKYKLEDFSENNIVKTEDDLIRAMKYIDDKDILLWNTFKQSMPFEGNEMAAYIASFIVDDCTVYFFGLCDRFIFCDKELKKGNVKGIFCNPDWKLGRADDEIKESRCFQCEGLKTQATDCKFIITGRNPGSKTVTDRIIACRHWWNKNFRGKNLRTGRYPKSLDEIEEAFLDCKPEKQIDLAKHMGLRPQSLKNKLTKYKKEKGLETSAWQYLKTLK